MSRLRIVIENDFNQALTPLNFEVSGFDHFLIARFTEKANYFLTYGNKSAEFPTYDIIRFEDKIPKEAQFLRVGSEEIISVRVPIKEPLFKNKVWLWLILGVIILIISWSMISMMRKKE